jgi:metallo-beta-lactamase class B
MKKFQMHLVIGLVACLVFAPSSFAQNKSSDLSDLTQSQIQTQRRLQGAQQHEAFKIFDNLYYVGINFVSAYLLTTPEGHILIDATYEQNVDHVLDGVKQMGFDPKDIKYILVTHWHSDHFGGALFIKERTNATIGMVKEDWDNLRTVTPVERDLVIKDGDQIVLGNTVLNCYHLPGHTKGVLGLDFTVYDKGTPHKAFVFGGAGRNFKGVYRTQQYLRSVDRVMGMDGIEVNVSNHQSMGQVFERYERLKQRMADGPHPFVDPEAFQGFLADMKREGELKLMDEKRKAGMVE